jgi:hypothetical protein
VYLQKVISRTLKYFTLCIVFLINGVPRWVGIYLFIKTLKSGTVGSLSKVNELTQFNPYLKFHYLLIFFTSNEHQIVRMKLYVLKYCLSETLFSTRK